MIRFLSKFPIFKEVYRLGGVDAFPLAHKDILETMRDDLDKQAEELSQAKLVELLSPVDWNKVITVSKTGSVFIGKERATDGQLANLRQEAEALEKFDLWAILYESPKALAEQAMFVSGDSIDSMKKGRSMLYTLSSQKRVLDILKTYQQK